VKRMEKETEKEREKTFEDEKRACGGRHVHMD